MDENMLFFFANNCMNAESDKLDNILYHVNKHIHRERNREHAKRSRIRKKFLLESLQQSVSLLKEENDKLKSSIRSHLGDKEADELLKKENLANTAAASNSLIATNSKEANKVLDDPDFSFIKALQTAQQNFVVTDPSLPDNPIVYATQGFLNLTGYSLDQVLGRNCRFLQGPETDPKAVEKIRKSIEEGTDMSVCLLNYRVDGTTFWNQFFIAALRDAAGNITNYVGVQCKVSDQYAANVCKRQEEEFARQEAEGAADFGDDFNDASSSHADFKMEDDRDRHSIMGMNYNFGGSADGSSTGGGSGAYQ
jgi:PAS domain S-box-containing protein